MGAQNHKTVLMRPRSVLPGSSVMAKAKASVFYLAKPATNDGASSSEGKRGQSGEKDLLGWLIPKDTGAYEAAHVACLLIGVGCN